MKSIRLMLHARPTDKGKKKTIPHDFIKSSHIGGTLVYRPESDCGQTAVGS